MKVFIIAALSADGYIGLDEVHKATTWTTTADKKFFVDRTKQAGTVVMGRKTFATINRPLKGRRLIIYTSDPQTVAMEGVETTSETPAQLVARLESEGVPELAICGGTSIYTQFMQAGVVGELYLTLMPKVFGKGITLFDGLIDRDLQLLSTTNLDENTVLLHYKTLH